MRIRINKTGRAFVSSLGEHSYRYALCTLTEDFFLDEELESFCCRTLLGEELIVACIERRGGWKPSDDGLAVVVQQDELVQRADVVRFQRDAI